MKKDYDAIVVGAGPGGSTMAALLAKNNLKVLLVDKNPRAGGRMMTFHKNGFYYELFPINGVPAKNSHFEKLLKVLGKENQIKTFYPEKIGVIIYEDREGKLRTWEMGTSNLGLLRALGVKLWNLKDLYRTLRVLKKLATVSQEEIDQLYDVSAMEYLDQFLPFPEGIYTYLLASFGEGAFEMTSDRTSAAEMIKLFQEAMKNSGGRYYEKGIGNFFEVISGTVRELGGEILMNTRVERINIENGCVKGITTTRGESFNAPVVVSNAGLRQTVLKLTGEEHFSPDYVNWVKKLESNLACVGFRWFLNKPVLEYPMYVYYPEGCVAKYEEFVEMAAGKKKPEKAYIYLGTTSLYPGLSPPGKQLVYACISCLGDPEIDTTPYLEYIEKMVRKIKPELFDHVEKTETFGPANVPGIGNDAVLPKQGGESYGIALSVGQAGHAQLKGDSPIKGLFYVGCDAGGSGLGTHQAVDSGINVSKMVLDFTTHLKAQDQ
ncbi:MAG: phytoene desaturase family protein [Candidatus Hodarchaeales archaeon]